MKCQTLNCWHADAWDIFDTTCFCVLEGSPIGEWMQPGFESRVCFWLLHFPVSHWWWVLGSIRGSPGHRGCWQVSVCGTSVASVALLSLHGMTPNLWSPSEGAWSWARCDAAPCPTPCAIRSARWGAGGDILPILHWTDCLVLINRKKITTGNDVRQEIRWGPFPLLQPEERWGWWARTGAGRLCWGTRLARGARGQAWPVLASGPLGAPVPQHSCDISRQAFEA